jgi:hypothetical protein
VYGFTPQQVGTLTLPQLEAYHEQALLRQSGTWGSTVKKEQAPGVPGQRDDSQRFASAIARARQRTGKQEVTMNEVATSFINNNEGGA